MYLNLYGKEIKTRLQAVQDILDFNLKLDVYDIPFQSGGVPQNFSKSTEDSIFALFRSSLGDIIATNKILSDSGVGIKSIGINKDKSNRVDIVVSVGDTELNFEVTK